MNFHVCNITKENVNGKKYKKRVIEFYESCNYKKRRRVSPNTLCKYLGKTRDIYTSKKEIERLTIMALEKGYNPFENNPKKVNDSIILSDYFLAFWDFDNSDYIATKNKFKSNSITRDSANKNKELIKRHVIISDNNAIDSDGNRIGYYLPEGLSANELTVSHIDKLQHGIIFDRGLSPKSYKNILSAINPPLKELLRKDLIKSNPLDRITKPTIDAKDTNIDAFKSDEIDKICNYIMDNIYSFNGVEWINQAFCIILAAATGMRQGEVLSLQSKNICMLEDSDFAAIHITRTHNDFDSFKIPKGRRDRWTYCDKRLAKVLIALQPDPDDLVFKGHLGTKDNILGTKGIRERLNFILQELDIKRSNEMKLVFHSLRHYANTELNVRGNADIANTIIGHSSSVMNERYYHPDANTMKEFASICGSLVPESALIKIEKYYNLEYKKESK